MTNLKFIQTLTAGVALATAFYPQAFATDDINCPDKSPSGAKCWTCGGTCTAMYSAGKLTIDGSGPMKNYSYTTNPLSTTAPWKEEAANIISIEVKGVSSTGNSAFLALNRVTEVKIGNSVTSIGNFSFDNMGSLHHVEIPDSVRTLGGDSFHGTPLTSITFGQNSQLTTLGVSAFEGVPFPKFVLPPSVTTIGQFVFTSTPASNIYCTGHQIESGICSSQSKHYELDDGMYVVYNPDNSIKGVYESNAALLQGIVADSYTKKDQNGNPLAIYSGTGSLISSYIYNPDGSTSIYDANGKLTGLKNAKSITPAQAAALVKKGNHNTVTLTFK